MAPLMTGMPKSEFKWSKLKSDYTWNDVYYLLRTKFAVYQIATTSLGPSGSLCFALLTSFKNRKVEALKIHPDATINVDSFIAAMACNGTAGILVSLFFTVALFFDLWWPERWEAPVLQWFWRVTGAAWTLFQLAASIFMTVVAVTSEVGITASTPAEVERIRSEWLSYRKLQYGEDPHLTAAIVFSWIGAVSAVCSLIIMYTAYWHNNRYGPFKDRSRQDTHMKALNVDGSEGEIAQEDGGWERMSS